MGVIAAASSNRESRWRDGLAQINKPEQKYKTCRSCSEQILSPARRCRHCLAHQLPVLGPVLDLGQPTLTLLVAVLAVAQSLIIVWTATSGPAPDEITTILVGPQSRDGTSTLAFMVANSGERAAVLSGADLRIPGELVGDPRLQPGALDIGGAQVVGPGEVVLVEARGLLPSIASRVNPSHRYGLRIRWVRANGDASFAEHEFMASLQE